MYVGGLSARVPMEVDRFTPTFRNVFIRDLIIEDGTWFLRVAGIPESPARNVTIERVTAHTQRLMQLHDLNMLTLRDAQLSAGSELIDISQVRNLYLENVTFDVPGGKADWQIEPGENENLCVDGKRIFESF
jgi:hypothetical protein